MEPIASRVYRTRFTFMSLRRFSAQSKIVLDEEMSASFSSNEMKYRHHPGIVQPRVPVFPEWASKEMHNILKEKQIKLKDVKESALQLNRHLHNRQLPVEQHEFAAKLEKVEQQINEGKTKNADDWMSIESIDFRTDAKARSILKRNVYNWQPINFDKSTSLTYMVARSVQNHAVLYKVLNEIKQRDKDLKPKTLFDFGSGIGTAMWTASAIWPNSMKEYFCVEVSEAMIELSERFAEVAQPKIKGISYRQYFPASREPTYDIVVSAYSLFEMPSEKSRLDLILKLWNKTENYLVIVEDGTNAGFKIVNQARDFILRYANSKFRTDRQPGHVFSPCPHDLNCPRFTTDNTPCNFIVQCQPMKFLDSKQHTSELYSYVVLKKSERPEDDDQWPRIVRATLQRHKHYICRMCTANAELREEIFTKYKNGKNMYRCAKSSVWGDRLPLCFEQREKNEEDKEKNTDNEGISNNAE